ncbi:MAG: class I SAM-dependent methyltransferase [Anaerolineae bacterium]|nr:class I SAM-dependent methyltransferase [Anaerolineae bacterium]
MTQAVNESYVVDRPMPSIFFQGMAAMFRIRDWLRPRGVLLDEIPLKAGDTILDYGCGPGSYIPELAARVGKNGVVIAVDIHPLAIQRVEELAKRQGLHNVHAYLSNGVHLPDLNDASSDVALLFDVFHMLGDQEGVLEEMHRILRPGGILAVNDPHMDPDDLAARVTRSGNFKLAKRGMHSFTFTPVVDQTAGGAAR